MLTSFLCSHVRCSWVCFSKVRVQWCPLEQFYILLYLSCCLVILAASCGWHLLFVFLLKIHRCVFSHTFNIFQILFVIMGRTPSMWISERVGFLGVWRGKLPSFSCAAGLQWEQGAKACSSGQPIQTIKGRLKGMWYMSGVLCSCFYWGWAVSTSAIVAVLAIFLVCFRVNIMDEKLMSCAELN